MPPPKKTPSSLSPNTESVQPYSAQARLRQIAATESSRGGSGGGSCNRAGDGVADAQSSDSIDENVSDLQARINRITNVINYLSNSIANNSYGGELGATQQPSHNFFSYPAYSVTGSSDGGGGGTPTRASLHNTALQVLGQELSLLTLLNFLCSAGDMEIPVNDNSLLQPTPFAPGQNAHSLHQLQRRLRRDPAHNSESFAAPSILSAPGQMIPTPVPVAATIVAPVPVSAPAVIVAQVPVPTVMIPPIIVMSPAMQFPQHIPGLEPLTLPLLQQRPAVAARAYDLLRGGVFSHSPSSSSSSSSLSPSSILSGELADQIPSQHPQLHSGGSFVKPMVLDPLNADLNCSLSAGLSTSLGSGMQIRIGQMNNNRVRNSARAVDVIRNLSSYSHAFTTASTPTGLPDQRVMNRSVTDDQGQLDNLVSPSDTAACTAPSIGYSKKARGVGFSNTRESRWSIRYNELLEVNHHSFSYSCSLERI